MVLGAGVGLDTRRSRPGRVQGPRKGHSQLEQHGVSTPYHTTGPGQPRNNKSHEGLHVLYIMAWPEGTRLDGLGKGYVFWWGLWQVGGKN